MFIIHLSHFGTKEAAVALKPQPDQLVPLESISAGYASSDHASLKHASLEHASTENAFNGSATTISALLSLYIEDRHTLRRARVSCLERANNECAWLGLPKLPTERLRVHDFKKGILTIPEVETGIERQERERQERATERRRDRDHRQLLGLPPLPSQRPGPLPAYTNMTKEQVTNVQIEKKTRNAERAREVYRCQRLGLPLPPDRSFGVSACWISTAISCGP